MAMDLEENYEIGRTVTFIRTHNFTRVALQFPDELLKDSTRVLSAIRDKLHSGECNGTDKDVALYVMADTTYGSCCVDEVGASHINADCVIHYGHTCLSLTSTLPALFVFGKAPVSVSDCAKDLSEYASRHSKPVLVLYGLEYAYAIQDIRDALVFQSCSLYYADVVCSVMNPLENSKTSNGCQGVNDNSNQGSDGTVSKQYRIGGLCWSLPDRHRIEDYLLCWVGAENEAFANIVLTFNGCDIVRYDAAANCLVTDVSHQRRILKRRYFLIEKAKDANIVGLLVGTLGVAGYLHMIHQMKELITRAGKKAYALVMGRPNPAKLANFPECDVFVYVSCPQTALLDSKEFLAPVITPFEAMLAFSRGSQWTGTYVMDFQDLMTSHPAEETQPMEEARFSFLQGGYVEDINLEETTEENEDGTLALAKATEKALWVADKDPRSVVKASPKSGAEYFAGRSFQGLDIKSAKTMPEPFFIGRTGKASGYEDEKSNQKSR